jgi:signal transduction histidine kinase
MACILRWSDPSALTHRGVVCRRLQKDGGWLLAVEDDGAGFEPGDTREGMHLGHASMRERLQLVDGSLDIESTPGEGTTVVAWVPGGGAT